MQPSHCDCWELFYRASGIQSVKRFWEVGAGISAATKRHPDCLFSTLRQFGRMNSFSACRVLGMALVLFLTSALASFAQAGETAITPTNKIQLFNGKDFSGWAFVSKDTNAPAA